MSIKVRDIVIKDLTDNPNGLRKRYFSFNVRRYRKEFAALKDEGLIYCKYMRDPVRMKYYKLWFLNKEGKNKK